MRCEDHETQGQLGFQWAPVGPGVLQPVYAGATGASMLPAARARYSLVQRSETAYEGVHFCRSIVLCRVCVGSHGAEPQEAQAGVDVSTTCPSTLRHGESRGDARYTI